jgi:hypothetical protein
VIIGTDCIGSYKSIRSRPRRPRLLLEWFVYFVFSYIIDHCCFILITDVVSSTHAQGEVYQILW